MIKALLQYKAHLSSYRDSHYKHTTALRLVSLAYNDIPDSKVHGANMGPAGSCLPQVGPMLAP